MTDDEPLPRPTHATIIFREPGSSNESSPESALRLVVPLTGGKVSDIKAMLQRIHPDKPAPATQRLIFAGRLLQDATPIADVLRQVSRLEPPK